MQASPKCWHLSATPYGITIPGDSNLHGHCRENFKLHHIFFTFAHNKMSVHISALLHYEISVHVLSAYLHHKISNYSHILHIILPWNISLHTSHVTAPWNIQLFHIFSMFQLRYKFTYIHMLPQWSIRFKWRPNFVFSLRFLLV